MIEALDTAGPAAQAARYEGSYMNPHDALGGLSRQGRSPQSRDEH